MTLKNEIEDKLKKYAEKIDVPKDLLPRINESNDFAYPYIEIENSGLMYLVIRERGIEHERRIAGTVDELLYLIFSKITFSMGIQYELKNRIEDQDSRKLIFARQIELLTALNESWAKRETWFN